MQFIKTSVYKASGFFNHLFHTLIKQRPELRHRCWEPVEIDRQECVAALDWVGQILLAESISILTEWILKVSIASES
jgi:hypothetical protein